MERIWIGVNLNRLFTQQGKIFGTDPQEPPSGEEPPEGQRLVAVEATLRNVGDKPWEYRVQDFIAIDSDGRRVYNPGPPTLGTTMPSRTLAPGEVQTGRVVFPVPTGRSVGSFRFKPLLEQELIIIHIPE